MSDVSHVDADLMGAAGFEAEFEVGETGAEMCIRDRVYICGFAGGRTGKSDCGMVSPPAWIFAPYYYGLKTHRGCLLYTSRCV